MRSRVTAKNVGDVFLRHTVFCSITNHAAQQREETAEQKGQG